MEMEMEMEMEIEIEKDKEKEKEQAKILKVGENSNDGWMTVFMLFFPFQYLSCDSFFPLFKQVW